MVFTLSLELRVCASYVILLAKLFNVDQHFLGRVFDMIKRRSLRTRNIKMLVLDEADEMLSKGFKEQV
jgi:hypothetical protein